MGVNSPRYTIQGSLNNVKKLIILLWLLPLLVHAQHNGPYPISGSGGSSGSAAFASSSAVQELSNAGVLGNLIDFAGFSSYYPMTNTYLGHQIFTTNVLAFTSKGAWCSNSASIEFADTIPPTNTIVINWWEDYNNNNGVFGFLYQAVNTANTNGEGFTYWGNTPPTGQFGQENVWGFNNALNYPANASNYTNLVYGALGNVIAGYNFNNLQRHTTAISCDGQGHIYVYEQGCQMGYFQDNATSSFNSYPTNNMNLMVLGNAFSYAGVPSQFQNGVNAYIESVEIFNTVLTTNLYIAAVKSTDWLQPATSRRIWVADSRSTTPFSATTLPVLTEALAGQYALPVNQAQGGQTLQSFYLATNIINFFPTDGKVTQDNIVVEGGVNDIYALSLTGTQVYNDLISDFAPYENDPRYPIDVFDLWQTSTNSSVYPQTTSGWNNSLLFDWLVYTNRYLFRNVYQESQLITQEMLNTNRNPQFSPDGLHFSNTTNGPTANEMVVGLVIAAANGGVNPYMPTNEFQNIYNGPTAVTPSTVLVGGYGQPPIVTAASPNVTVKSVTGYDQAWDVSFTISGSIVTSGPTNLLTCVYTNVYNKTPMSFVAALISPAASSNDFTSGHFFVPASSRTITGCTVQQNVQLAELAGTTSTNVIEIRSSQ